MMKANYRQWAADSDPMFVVIAKQMDADTEHQRPKCAPWACSAMNINTRSAEYGRRRARRMARPLIDARQTRECPAGEEWCQRFRLVGG
jgi:hypothetical protein